MSGVELAGLVLAVIPLVISALEDYNEGLDPIKSFMKWERELPKYIRKLRNQHVHYEQTLRILICPITTEYELAQMIAEPNGDLWRDPEMTSKLEDKLQESYKAYQCTMSDIQGIMEKIANKLDLERAGDANRNVLEAILAANPPVKGRGFELKKRAKFSMSKKKIKSLLEELDECNQELERFTDKSERLEPYRKSSKPSLAAKLQKIQGYAKTLHSTLVDAFSCSCRASHCTNLQLEQRGMAKYPKSKNEDGMVFKLSFTNAESSSIWQEAEIRVSELDTESFNASMSSLTLAPSTPRTGRSVSFTTPLLSPSPKCDSVFGGVEEHSLKLETVSDICEAIHNFGDQKTCMGLSLENGRLCGTYPVTGAEPKLPCCADVVTLEDLLKSSNCLSRRERYTLAVTVASSILQLNSTPWFEDEWSKRDIMFYRTVASSRPVDVNHPHITHKSSPNPGPGGAMSFNRNASLLALGVMLLELYFGSLYEAKQEPGFSPADQGGQNLLARWAVAWQWYDNEKENLSAAFQGAIAHCFRCFGDPSCTLQDPVFLQSAADQIVLPLQDELSQFLGRSA